MQPMSKFLCVCVWGGGRGPLTASVSLSVSLSLPLSLCLFLTRTPSLCLSVSHSLSLALPLSVPLSLSVSLCQLAALTRLCTVCPNAEKGIKDAFYLMGLRPLAYWLSWLMAYMLVLLVPALLVAFVSVQFGVLQSSAYFPIVVVLYVYSLSVTCLAFVFTPFFSNSKVGFYFALRVCAFCVCVHAHVCMCVFAHITHSLTQSHTHTHTLSLVHTRSRSPLPSPLTSSCCRLPGLLGRCPTRLSRS